MARSRFRISPDVQCIRHRDWEDLALSFKCIVVSGDKIVEVEGDSSSINDWENFVSGIEGVSISSITSGQLQDIKSEHKKLGLKEEIREMRVELLAKENRYQALGGNLGDI